MYQGDRVIQSLKTRDWAKAGKLMASMVDAWDATVRGKVRAKPLSDAVAQFLDSKTSPSPNTNKTYKTFMTAFAEAGAGLGIVAVKDWTVDTFGRYAAARRKVLAPYSWQGELKLVRQFFRYAVERDWIKASPVGSVRAGRVEAVREIEPYTSEEIEKIMQAIERSGRGPEDRKRYRAIVWLMRRYGFRISDACMFQRKRVKDGAIFLRAMKNKVVLWVPLYPEVKEALEAMGGDGEYYFYHGGGTKESFISSVDYGLRVIYRKAGVRNAANHRFRHTLATELLGEGATMDDVANILGDDPETVRKHYARWGKGLQERTAGLLGKVRGEG